MFRGPIRWWSNLNSLAGEDNDKHTHKIATLMMSDTEQRDRLTEGIYIPTGMNEALGRLEETFRVTKRAEHADEKMRKAVHQKLIPKVRGAELIKVALEKGIITAEEKSDLIRSEELRNDAIQVDDFSDAEYHGTTATASKGNGKPGWNEGPKPVKVI